MISMIGLLTENSIEKTERLQKEFCSKGSSESTARFLSAWSSRRQLNLLFGNVRYMLMQTSILWNDEEHTVLCNATLSSMT